MYSMNFYKSEHRSNYYYCQKNKTLPSISEALSMSPIPMMNSFFPNYFYGYFAALQVALSPNYDQTSLDIIR